MFCVGARRSKIFHLPCTILRVSSIIADNSSQLHCLLTSAQLAEEKSLVDPAVVSDDKDETDFLDQKYSGLMSECSVNLPEVPHSDHNPLN